MMPEAEDPAIAQARANFETAAANLDLYPPGGLPVTGVSFRDLRRRRRRDVSASAGTITLIERDGALIWELGPTVPFGAPDQRRFRTRPLGRVIARKEFVALGQNEIVGYLEKLDGQLTPKRGLSAWDNTQAKLIPVGAVANKGTILLVIHGTFSCSTHLFDEIRDAPNGNQFLARAAAHYTQILAFDHPTVSVSTLINAIDLRNALAASGADVDIVCHSRGGLVARWWMEAFDASSTRRKRAVFVAAPLEGTSLASPVRLRAGLNVLATFSKLLGTAAMAVPFMTAPAAILRIVGSVVGVTSQTPLVDAVLAMIPGLSSQSRVDNNSELQRLNKAPLSAPQYYFVSSDFQSTSAGWNIFKYIREAKIRGAETAVDLLVFPDKNDIVVDTTSMTNVTGHAVSTATNLLDFGTNGEVHHTNYFRNQRTLDFILSSFGIA